MGDPAQYAPGQRLPGTVYRVVRHLATGGMGSVYDVEDVTVGKRYVLKTLHPQLIAREDLAKRMEQEARALAKLQHPNIVDVVTAGMTADDRRMPFYVMERLNGQNLRVVLEKKGSLDLTHCYRIAIDVLEALEHAHENAIIHRDVKPENIFLHRNANGTTTTKLLDFGIMRLLDRKTTHTQGKFLGTLRYASPEQIMGGELGPATDIYSLGLVLYEMIAGRGPFDDIKDVYAIGAAHAQQPPPPLSNLMSVPKDVERLVMASISKQPHERPRDCFSFAGQLRRMLRDEEAAPKSVTAVNVLTSGAEAAVDEEAATSSSLPLAGTEPSPTDVGMPPPTVGEDVAIESEVVASSTLPREASEKRGERPGEKPRVDRAAATHTSDVSHVTRRLARHDTEMGSESAAMPDDAVRAALAERAPLEVPPASGSPPASSGRDLVFPNSYSSGVSGTGPLAGEARTRPPERSLLAPLLAAVAASALVIVGAIVFVTKPWQRRATATAPAVASAAAVTTTMPVTSTAVAPPASALLATAPLVTASASASATPTPSHAPAAALPTRSPRAPMTGAIPSPTSTASTPRKPTPPARPGAPRPEEVGFD